MRRGRIAIVSVLALLAALTTLTLLLLIEEFTTALSPPSPARGADQPANAMGRAVAPRGKLPFEISVDPPWLRAVEDRLLKRIGVGSCLHQRHPQPIWKNVIAARPDLFLMLGDNIYGDIRNDDPIELALAYQTQADHPELKAARKAMPFLATWDDHDYGENDAGAGFRYQSEAAAFFRAFWQLPEAENADGGIYYAKMLGPDTQRVQLIMLDTRTFRSPLRKKTSSFPYWGKYEPDLSLSKTLLGRTQWAWLREQLQQPAQLRLIVSSIQVLAEGHGWERWGNLPLERARLRALLRETGARGVVLLSGDRHSAAIYKTPRDGQAAQPHLVELTASSLNRAFGPSKDTRLPPLVSEIYYPENFGVIDIDWEARALMLSIRGIDGRSVVTERVSFADLGVQ